MAAFINFARKMTSRCFRNVIFVGRLQRSIPVSLLILLAACLCSFEALAEMPTDADITRAVRIVRNGESMMTPGVVTASGVSYDLDARVNAAMKFLSNVTQSEFETVYKRLADEFMRQDALESLFGFKFGVGVSVTTGHRKNAIRDAVVDTNRIVRITREEESTIGYLLEAHYFFVPDRPFLSLTPGNWGYGPFVAIQAGNEKALSGLGFGMMVGFRQLGSGMVPVSNLSWNIGVGALYDPSVKVLGSGIVANQPLPAGETVLRTTEVGGWGLMIMSSFNF
jgi:hypothetical protein